MDTPNVIVSFDSPEFGELRVIDAGGESWFVARDVTDALGLDRTAVRKLDDDEKGVRLTHTLGGEQEISIVSEPGLYKLVMRSRKPRAKAFQRGVTHEVLPSIRRTGGYMTVCRGETPEQAFQSLLDYTQWYKLLCTCA